MAMGSVPVAPGRGPSGCVLSTRPVGLRLLAWGSVPAGCSGAAAPHGGSGELVDRRVAADRSDGGPGDGRGEGFDDPGRNDRPETDRARPARRVRCRLCCRWPSGSPLACQGGSCGSRGSSGGGIGAGRSQAFALCRAVIDLGPVRDPSPLLFRHGCRRPSTRPRRGTEGSHPRDPGHSLRREARCLPREPAAVSVVERAETGGDRGSRLSHSPRGLSSRGGDG